MSCPICGPFRRCACQDEWVPQDVAYLECPCCGDDGAASNSEGCFYDGQALICGCVGWVSVDEDGEAWINNGDDPCPCEARDDKL